LRKKKIFENEQARALREQDQERLQAQEERRRILRNKLAQSGDRSSAGQIIVNDAKYEKQGFVYVNKDIARRVKPHQVDGIRFMWNQIISSDGKQGCLLAHTMGLGKTMQA
jgi:SNF2 family DNA or RNA helicase